MKSLPPPSPYGTHRVIEPADALPQQAWRLDASPAIFANEILCAVDWLNIDAASFRQIREATDGSADAIGAHIRATVAERGKQHNAVTGSGGMFIGRVADIGHELAGRVELQIGDPIASLVSLTLTPLQIDAILELDLKRGRIRITGHAILFASGIWTRLPPDLPMTAALALFDVAGAPAHVARLAKAGQTILIIGADGKSGLLSCAAARLKVGPSGRVIGVVPDAHSAGAQLLAQTGLAEVIEADARGAIALHAKIVAAVPALCDLVVNCVNVAGTELASILCTRERGAVCFFSMATSLSAAALGAEGLGRDIDLLIGNGYVAGHVEVARSTLRGFPVLERYFVETYGEEPR